MLSGPSETWLWLPAVRHPCCCPYNDWSVQIHVQTTLRCCWKVPCRPTWRNNIYKLCILTRLQQSARFSATLPTRCHSACRWSHFTTSTTVIIFICPAGAGNATYHNNLPSMGLELGITYQTSSPIVRHRTLTNIVIIINNGVFNVAWITKLLLGTQQNVNSECQIIKSG